MKFALHCRMISREDGFIDCQVLDDQPQKATSLSLFSAELVGLDVPLLEVEVHASNGLPKVDIVGLAEPCVRESRQRVRAAIMASGWSFPREKITINLAPASLKKMATGLDLAMALGILMVCKKIKVAESENVKKTLFMGELSLSGSLKPVAGILNVVLMAHQKGFQNLILPVASAKEAALVDGVNLFPARNLLEVTRHLEGITFLHPFRPNKEKATHPKPEDSFPKLEEIRGQSLAKKALLIAAAGGHNLLFVGPPGAGKTLLARTFPGLLPRLTQDESLETTRIYHCSGNYKNPNQMISEPPFRAPHHSITDAGLMGGGKFLLPGELSLAHNGVLFLDELPEFKRHVLEILREPLESGQIHLSRAQGFVRYPARIQLLAAMNPCPCGYWGVDEGICHCSPATIQKYSKRISGPLLDRIDLRLFLHPVPCHKFFEEVSLQNKKASKRPTFLLNQLESLTSLQARALIERVRKKQAERFAGEPFYRNAFISAQKLKKYCPLSEEAKRTLIEGLKNPFASGRSIHRLLRVARTLADLQEEGGETPRRDFLSPFAIEEAIFFWQMPDLWNF